MTSSCFFEKITDSDIYQEKENFIYSGGGHTVLQFQSKEIAKKFVQRITEEAMREFEGLEIFAKLMAPQDYKACRTPGEVLKELSKRLEQKKSKRKEAFHVYRYT